MAKTSKKVGKGATIEGPADPVALAEAGGEPVDLVEGPADQRAEGPADQMVIKDLETLKVLTDPMRLQILELMAKPITVKVVAKSLDMPPTKLYYHVSQLEEHGIIRVVATRVVSGIIEKQYQVTAKSFSIDRSLLSLDKHDWREWDGIWHNLIDGVSADIRAGLESGLIQIGDEHPKHKRLMLGRSIIKMTPEQANAFAEKLKALLEEYDQGTPGKEAQPGHGHSPAAQAAQPYSILIAFHLHTRAQVKEESDE